MERFTLKINSSSLGVAIKELRKNAKLSQKEVSENCGFSRGYLSQLEGSIQKNPGDDLLNCIAETTNGDSKILFELRDYSLYNDTTSSQPGSLEEELQLVRNKLNEIGNQLNIIESSVSHAPKQQRTAEEIASLGDLHPDNV